MGNQFREVGPFVRVVNRKRDSTAESTVVARRRRVFTAMRMLLLFTTLLLVSCAGGIGLGSEAGRDADAFLKGSLLKCGDSYYSAEYFKDSSTGTYVTVLLFTQYKDFVIETVPYEVTAADKSNGYSWRGRVEISGVYRYGRKNDARFASPVYGVNGWREWQNVRFILLCDKRYGNWHIKFLYKPPGGQPITCADLP